SGSTFPIATTTVTCTAADAAGNTASKSFTVTVTAQPDTTPPVVTVPANITAEATSPAGAGVTYSASAPRNVGGPVPVTCTPASGSTFPLGTTTVTCTATDKAGNVGSASFTVTVKDTTAPAITVPANITTVATSAAGAVVTYTANATDAVGVTSFACTPASGSTFPIATTTVTCTAAEAAGNTARKSFMVTGTPPPAPAPPGTTGPRERPAG